MKPYVVLGTYWPKVWSAFRVGNDILAITRKLGLRPLNDPIHGPQTWAPWCSEKWHAEVKRRTPKNPKGEDWHQDGDLDPGSRMDCGIVLWATNTPTQIRVGTNIFQPKPKEIILFRNLVGHHRRPPDAPRIRWIFRQRVEPAEVKKWLP